VPERDLWLTMRCAIQSRAGFSTVEVLVASFLLLSLTATMLWSYRFHLFALKRQEAQLDVQETARSLIDVVTREVRQAGYDPTCVKTFEALADARPNLLRVKFDRNSDGVIGTDEDVTYNYDSGTQDVGRTANGIRNLLATGLPIPALSFAYFDGGGAVLVPTGSPAALSAAQRAAARRVRVTVHLERSQPLPFGTAPVVSEMVTNVDLRNRFFNSGVGCP
jgi:hypothetical protein